MLQPITIHNSSTFLNLHNELRMINDTANIKLCDVSFVSMSKTIGARSTLEQAVQIIFNVEVQYLRKFICDALEAACNC